MTAPRWIAEAIEAAYENGPGDGKLATALIERLPLEAIAAELVRERSTDRDASLMAIVRVLTDGDPEVVSLTELYQGACKALDDAGVPYASSVGELGAMVTLGPAEPLDLADRIRWLAQQRPTRLELQRVEAERDWMSKSRDADHAQHKIDLAAARSEAHTLGEFIRAAHEELTAAGVAQSPSEPQHMMDSAFARRVRALRDERDHLRVMYEGASDDLHRERTSLQDAESAAAEREVTLGQGIDNARRETQELKAAVVERNTALRTLVESDMPAGELRRALAELIGVDAKARVFAATDRQVLRAKVADQAAYIEQLELEIAALEDQIDRLDGNPDLPDMWTGCKVGAP